MVFIANTPIRWGDEAAGGSLKVTLTGSLRDATELWLTLLPSGLRVPRRLGLGPVSTFRTIDGGLAKGIALADCDELLAQAICSGHVMLEWRPDPPPAVA